MIKKVLSSIIKISSVSLVIGLLIALVLFPLYVGLKYGQLPSITEYWIQYISVFLSSFSFGAVILTLWLQHKEEEKQQKQIKMNFEFAQHNYDSQILDKIHFFSSDSMASCRAGACKLWHQMEIDESAKDKIYQYFIMTITNSEEDNEGISEEEFYKNFCAFFKLIRYFNVLSFYSFNNITANAVHYYYVYYRQFFCKMIDLYNQACDTIDDTKQVTTVRENWIDLVKKFDSIMMQNNLPLS